MKASVDHNSQQKLLGIEFGRGIAATMVVLYHASRHMGINGRHTVFESIFQFGHTGVDFFFVLSGFIIYFVHSKDFDTPQSLARYGERRFTRIFPLYWIVTLTVLLLQIANRGESPGWQSLATSATLLPTGNPLVVGVAWTLQHELLFYLLFATLLVSRRIGMFVLALWLALILANWQFEFSRRGGPLGYKICHVFNLQFFMGMAAAWLTLTVKPKGMPYLLAGAGLFLFFGTLEDMSMLDEYGSDARIFFGVSSFLLVCGLANTKGLDKHKDGLLRTLGSASYAIYLTHLAFIGIGYKVWEATGLLRVFPAWATFLVLVAAGIGGGVLVSRFVEYPAMRWVQRHWPGRLRS